MQVLKVRKIGTTLAVQITDEESETLVRSWLAAMGRGEADLTELVQAQAYFMKDEGSPLVYLVQAPDILTEWEELDEVELKQPETPEEDEALDAAIKNILDETSVMKTAGVESIVAAKNFTLAERIQKAIDEVEQLMIDADDLEATPVSHKLVAALAMLINARGAADQQFDDTF